MYSDSEKDPIPHLRFQPWFFRIPSVDDLHSENLIGSPRRALPNNSIASSSQFLAYNIFLAQAPLLQKGGKVHKITKRRTSWRPAPCLPKKQKSCQSLASLLKKTPRQAALDTRSDSSHFLPGPTHLSLSLSVSLHDEIEYKLFAMVKTGLHCFESTLRERSRVITSFQVPSAPRPLSRLSRCQALISLSSFHNVAKTSMKHKMYSHMQCEIRRVISWKACTRHNRYAEIDPKICRVFLASATTCEQFERYQNYPQRKEQRAQGGN